MAENKNYSVLKKARASELPPDTEVFVPLGTVDAPNPTGAIVKITEDGTAEAKNGEFAAPSTRNFPVYPRTVELVEDDSFGEAQKIAASSTNGTAAAAVGAGAGDQPED